MRALVIDDSHAMRTVLSRMLREIGYDVSQAADATEALEYFRKSWVPNVTLVDWNMPGMSGLEFIRVVRRELGDRDVLLMMVTTESEPTRVVKAFAAGANEYLMKPFTKEALFEKLTLLGVGPDRRGRSES